jgi:hypothetical protein
MLFLGGDLDQSLPRASASTRSADVACGAGCRFGGTVPVVLPGARVPAMLTDTVSYMDGALCPVLDADSVAGAPPA